MPTRDANDMLYQIAASSDYDPSAGLEKITVPVTWVNSSDDFINPPSLGIAEPAAKRLKNGKFILIQATPDTRGHGTHTWAVNWKQDLIDLLARSGVMADQHRRVGREHVDLQIVKMEHAAPLGRTAIIADIMIERALPARLDLAVRHEDHARIGEARHIAGEIALVPRRLHVRDDLDDRGARLIGRFGGGRARNRRPECHHRRDLLHHRH
jgi:hypothetical protein